MEKMAGCVLSWKLISEGGRHWEERRDLAQKQLIAVSRWDVTPSGSQVIMANTEAPHCRIAVFKTWAYMVTVRCS